MENSGIFQAVRPDTGAVQGSADRLNTAGGIDFSDLAVARLLHRIEPVPAQQLDQQVIQKVGSRTDENVFRVHMHAPEGGQMFRNGGFQLRDAGARHGQQQLFAVIQHDLPLQLHPDGEGKLLCAAAG